MFYLNGLNRPFKKAEHVLCPDAYRDGSMGCIDPGGCQKDTPCKKCGFGQFWSRGLRHELVDKNGDLKPGVNAVWLTQVL